MKRRLNSKGQVTLPAKIRQQLNLQTGDTLDLQIGNGTIKIVPLAKGSLETFMSVLPKASRSKKTRRHPFKNK